MRPASRSCCWSRTARCWDQLQIRRGIAALARARELGGAGGFYALQAAIIACHAQAGTADETDWPRIAALYAELAALVRSPVDRAQPRGGGRHGRGAGAGLAIVDRLVHEPALKNYHLLGSVRGDLLHKLGRFEEARAAFEAAAALAGNAARAGILETACRRGGSPLS